MQVLLHLDNLLLHQQNIFFLLLVQMFHMQVGI
jgi:hypothetical protein